MDPKNCYSNNELAKKKNRRLITREKKVKQAKLREEYIEGSPSAVSPH